MIHRAVIVLACFLLSLLLQSASSESNLDSIKPVDDGPKLDDTPYGTARSIRTDKVSTGQREKRFYNYFDSFDYNYNPDFQTYPKRVEDPLELILKKLQEISNAVKQRTYLPPQPPIQQPQFIPFFFVPKITCPCENKATPSPPNMTLPTNETSINNNITADNAMSTNKYVPNLPTRFPDIEDSREIWGIVDESVTQPDYNDDNDGNRPISLIPIQPKRPLSRPPPPESVTQPDYNDDNDGNRPISLIPIQPKRPLSRPPPPVEHGSEQAGLSNAAAEAGPLPIDNIQTEQDLDTPSTTPETGLTACEAAAITCCHQPHVTYACFTTNNCTDTSSLGNPCDSQVILKIITKLQDYYDLNNGPTGS